MTSETIRLLLTITTIYFLSASWAKIVILCKKKLFDIDIIKTFFTTLGPLSNLEVLVTEK